MKKKSIFGKQPRDTEKVVIYGELSKVLHVKNQHADKKYQKKR